jgi:hypothetical protein
VTGGGPALAGASFGRWCILSLYVLVRAQARSYRGIARRQVASSGLRPSLATADSLPSPHRQSGGFAAQTCFATLARLLPFARRRLYEYRVGRSKLVVPRRASAIRISRGRSTRRHDRRRVFACLLVAPVFLLEGNSVTARLSFETPARLSLAALERLTLRAVYHGPQHHGMPVQRSECHTSPAKMHLIDQFRRRGAYAVRLRRARVETVNSMSVQIDGDRTVVRLPGSRCLSRRDR